MIIKLISATEWLQPTSTQCHTQTSDFSYRSTYCTELYSNLDSSVTIVTRLRDERLENRGLVPGGSKKMSASKRPSGLCSPHSILFNGDTGGYFRELKRPEREADDSLPRNASIKNEWRCTSAPPIGLHVAGREKLIQVY